jgi:C-terminal processing protease CtpA/Prc
MLGTGLGSPALPPPELIYCIAVRRLVWQLVLVLEIALGCAKTEPPSEVPPIELLDRIWRVIAEKYPALDYVGADGDALLAEFRPRVAAAPSRPAALEIMAEMVARLSDYHTRLEWNEAPRKTPGFYVEPVVRDGAQTVRASEPTFQPFAARPAQLSGLEPYAVAVVSVDRGAKVQVGDEILAIDGIPIAAAVKAAWRRATGSSHLARLRAASDAALFGEPNSEATLVVARAGASLTTTSPRVGRFERPLIAAPMVDGIPVIRVTELANRNGDRLAQAMDDLLLVHRNAAGIVLDVRDNPGGNDGVADEVTGRFIDRPVVSSMSFLRKGEANHFERMIARAQPRGPWRFAGRVALLVDEGCRSACVHFVSGMRAAGARLFGTPTDGACGWTERVTVGPGIDLVLSRTFPIQSNGLPGLLGIAPQHQIQRTLADLVAGRDPVLEAAVAFAKGAGPP